MGRKANVCSTSHHQCWRKSQVMRSHCGFLLWKWGVCVHSHYLPASGVSDRERGAGRGLDLAFASELKHGAWAQAEAWSAVLTVHSLEHDSGQAPPAFSPSTMQSTASGRSCTWWACSLIQVPTGWEILRLLWSIYWKPAMAFGENTEKRNQG